MLIRNRLNLFRRCAAEFTGTFGLVFAGTGAIMVDHISGGMVTNLGIGLTFGLIVAAMIYSLGHISGAHINPAVTLGFAVARKFPWKEVPFYGIAQLSGAAAASLVLWGLLGNTAEMGATTPSGSAWQSFGDRNSPYILPHAGHHCCGHRPEGPEAGRTTGHRRDRSPGGHLCRSHFRSVNEPRQVVGSGSRRMDMGPPLDILGGACHRSGTGCHAVPVPGKRRQAHQRRHFRKLTHFRIHEARKRVPLAHTGVQQECRNAFVRWQSGLAAAVLAAMLTPCA